MIARQFRFLLRLTAFIACALGALRAEDHSITTVAGAANNTSGADGTPGSFNNPYGVAIDAAKNLYVTDTVNYTVRKITPGRVVSTLAGTAKDFPAKWDTVRKAALARPFGDPTEVKKAAGEMAAWCDDFLKKSEADGRPLYTKAESEKLLAAIAAAATSKTWTADPEAAMHLTWAYLSLRDGMGLAPQAGAVDALGKTVPVRVRSMPYTMKLPDPKDPEKMIDGPVPAGAAIRPRLQLFAGFKAEDFTAKFAELLKK